jgi:AcrR family transcriptional regulator
VTGNVAENEDQSLFDLLWTNGRGLKRGPKPKLTREAVVDAAIALADREGLGAVTMQRLAGALNSKPMTLYRHVPSKDVMVELMWDAAFGTPPAAQGGDWREGLSAWAAESFATLERHPWMIELVGSIRSVGPVWTAWLETGLAAMRDLPLSAGEKLSVLTLIDCHLRSAAILRFGVKASPEWAENFGRMLERVSDDDGFPALGRLVQGGDLSRPGMSMDEMFDFGLDRILDGIAAFATQPGQTQP